MFNHLMVPDVNDFMRGFNENYANNYAKLFCVRIIFYTVLLMN